MKEEPSVVYDKMGYEGVIRHLLFTREYPTIQLVQFNEFVHYLHPKVQDIHLSPSLYRPESQLEQLLGSVEKQTGQPFKQAVQLLLFYESK